MNIRSLVKQILTEKENKKYEKLLAARRTTYEQWIKQKEIQNAAQEESAGEVEVDSERKIQFRCFISPDGMLAEHSLSYIAQYFQEHLEVKILYGDEDVLEDGVRKCPWFKPDWSPDLLESCFYFGSVLAVREELIQHMEETYEPQYSGNMLQTFSIDTEINVYVTAKCTTRLYEIRDFQAYEKWVHQCAACAGAYLRYSDAVGHISEILFHCKNEEEQRKYLKPSEFVQNIQMAYLHDFEDGRKRNGTKCSEDADVTSEPIVSVIIPSKDQPAVLERCVRSFCRAAEDYKTEVIIVDNGSNKDNRCYIEKMIENLEQKKVQISYLYQPMEFHFSKMCNMGAKCATGRYLLFLNDDVELIHPEVIVRMGVLADREWTGAVGLKLYYPESDRIQHAGITNLPMGPVHKLQFLSDAETYYFDANRGLHNVLAVTAACLMVEKGKFDEVGGFTEDLPVAFNDVDLCFLLYEKGYHNVCINDMYAYHHESLSRGNDESVEKRARLMAERDKLYARHSKLEGRDPYYSECLNREGLDVRIRPAYESAGNRMQEITGKLSVGTLKEYREDACVHLRVESLREGILQGYCVVLGDDNACYEKEIVLIQETISQEMGVESAGQDDTGVVYCIPTTGQYRSDLAENMPDQTNVALSGFWLKISKEALASVPRGRYLVGMAVRNKVTGLKIFNKSNCYLMNDPR